MKRSEINLILQDVMQFTRRMNFLLPPFAYWSPEDWLSKGSEYDEIRDNMLGWDITDFGSEEYKKIGLLMFTMRNGSISNPKYTKPYAEKLLITDENQVTPFHYHFNKMEDIINRGGGILVVKLYNSTPTDGFSDSSVIINMDGRSFEAPAGTPVMLSPGESITLPCGMYHSFWALGGHGRVLLGEVSKVNDDTQDNYFYDPIGRFPAIEEDEKPLYMLFSEYPKFAEDAR